MMVHHSNQKGPVSTRYNTHDSGRSSLILCGRFCSNLLPILAVELRLSMINLKSRLSSKKENLPVVQFWRHRS